MATQLIRKTPHDNAIVIFPGDTETFTIDLPDGVTYSSGDTFTLTVRTKASPRSALVLTQTSSSNTFTLTSAQTSTLLPGKYSARVTLTKTVSSTTSRVTIYPDKAAVRFGAANWENFVVKEAP